MQDFHCHFHKTARFGFAYKFDEHHAQPGTPVAALKRAKLCRDLFKRTVVDAVGQPAVFIERWNCHVLRRRIE